jgi:hypothetical protein
MRRKWEGIKGERQDNMTVVDFLLNEKEWYLANVILSEFRSLLKVDDKDNLDPGGQLDILV